MKQCFCDCCGKQVNEKELTSKEVSKYEVDLCFKCSTLLAHSREDAINKADEEFIKTMEHQPLGFKYMCE